MSDHEAAVTWRRIPEVVDLGSAAPQRENYRRLQQVTPTRCDIDFHQPSSPGCLSVGACWPFFSAAWRYSSRAPYTDRSSSCIALGSVRTSSPSTRSAVLSFVSPISFVHSSTVLVCGCGPLMRLSP